MYRSPRALDTLLRLMLLLGVVAGPPSLAQEPDIPPPSVEAADTAATESKSAAEAAATEGES
ncbi:MAG: hypothetical protein KJO13_08845, partial [Gammaproteobacteria bacterium]|nr:hypothetical protein [Gammaproteobacteria bacterium]